MDGRTDEGIRKAFDETTSHYKQDVGELVIIKKEDYRRVLPFLKDHLVKTEPICQGVNFQWSQQMGDMFRGALDRNLSLMLLDKKSGDVIGTRIIDIAKKKEPVPSVFDDPSLEQMVEFWHFGDKISGFFEKYNTNEAFHFFGLGVKEDYRHRGIATMLVDFSIQFLKNLNIRPTYIKAEASSNYSQKIFEKNGFDELQEIKYDQYKLHGEIVIKSEGEHKSMKTYGKLLLE